MLKDFCGTIAGQTWTNGLCNRKNEFFMIEVTGFEALVVLPGRI